MLNNVDLNSQDSFYPQFDTCTDSSVGVMDTKDHQNVFMDAEHTTSDQFSHGKSLHAESCVTVYGFTTYGWMSSRYVAFGLIVGYIQHIHTHTQNKNALEALSNEGFKALVRCQESHPFPKGC